MKKTSLILNVVLFIGLGLLYFFHFSANKSDSTNFAGSATDSTNQAIKIAYVNLDSILLNYELSKELNEAITTKQGTMKSRLEREGSEFEKDAQVFQDKVQKGLFLTQQRAEEAQQKLMMRQQELQNLEMEYSKILNYEQQSMNARLFDSINNVINALNTPEVYHMIFAHSVASNILYGSEEVEITNQVLEELNKRYTIE